MAEIARQPQSCLQTSVGLLARREHSRLELQRKLALRGFASDEIDSVLDELEGGNLLSDERYAEAFTRQRVMNGNGPIKIRHELKERGVSGDLIAKALESWREQWVEVATKQHEKRFGKMPEDVKERARQTRYLQGRGFGFDVIRQIIAD